MYRVLRPALLLKYQYSNRFSHLFPLNFTDLFVEIKFACLDDNQDVFVVARHRGIVSNNHLGVLRSAHAQVF